jgi:hypothetical protein
MEPGDGDGNDKATPVERPLNERSPEVGAQVGEPPAAQSPEGGRDAQRKQAQRLFEMNQSFRVIGAQVGVSDAAVRKWAKAGRWERGEATTTPMVDLPTTAKVVGIRPDVRVEGAPEVLARSQARKCEPEGGSQCEPDENLPQTGQPLDQLFRARVRELLQNPTRDEAADVAARAVVQVVREHRASIVKAQALADRLLGQLDLASNMREELEDFIISETEPGKYRSMLMRMVSLPAHAGVLRDIATAQVKLQGLERQAFGLRESDDPMPKEEAAKEAQAVEVSEFDRIRERARLKLAGGTT